ncbi:Peptide deformylase [Prochlorococcus marinus str. MIT 1320]|nr:Peptide deformylase [Prochlorococcus marinus str. MIT 1320]
MIMAVKEILRMGNPQLRQVSNVVDDASDELIISLIKDLQDTVKAHQGAGLAAPQIGVPLRVVLFGGGGPNPRYPEAPSIPQTILINPVLTPIGSDLEDGWEGCLSVPGLRGQVSRWSRIHYRALNENGFEIEHCLEGFPARVIQHECDHLDGVLFPDRLVDSASFGFTGELEAAGIIAKLARAEQKASQQSRSG